MSSDALEARLDEIEENFQMFGNEDVPLLVKALRYSLEQMQDRIHYPIIVEIERGVSRILRR